MRTARTLAALVAVGVGLAACSGADTTAEADLRVAVAQLPSTLEQLHTDPFAGSVLFHNVYETLFEYDDREQRLRPLVATRYEYLDDDSLELTIRDDVRFHDGTVLTAELLASQFARLDEELGDALTLTDVEVVDATRVRLHTAELELGLVGLLTTAPTALWLPSPDEGAPPVGTGPYELSRFTLGESLELRRVDDDRFTTSRYDTVAVEVVDGPMAQITAVAAGEADLAPRIGSAWAETVAATDGVRFYDPDQPDELVEPDPVPDPDGLLDLDECGTRLFPMSSPSPLLTNLIFTEMDPVDVPSLFGPDDFENYTPFDGIDCNRFHAEAGLEFLVVADDLQWDAQVVWRVDLRQP